MNDTPLFDWLADVIDRDTSLTRLEARGVLRLALQRAAIDPKELTAAQAEALLQAALPRDLEDRGFEGAAELCRRIREELLALGDGPPPTVPPPAAAAPLPLFEWLAHALEGETTLTRLEARGTLRLALKAAGLVPERVTRRQAEVVLETVAPAHLRASRIPGADAICARLRMALRTAAVVENTGPESPEEIFGRLGRRPSGPRPGP